MISGILESHANIPEKPELPWHKAQNLLDTAWLTYVRYLTGVESVDLSDIKGDIQHYKNILTAHSQREQRINKEFSDIDPMYHLPAIKTMADKSTQLVVIYAKDDMPAARLGIFKDFVNQGGDLTLFTAQDPDALPGQSYSTLYRLPPESMDALHESNTAGLIVGNGNGGCFFHEKNEMSQTESLKRGVASFAALSEAIGNIFRKNKKTAALDDCNVLKNTPIESYRMEMSFCHPDKAREIYTETSNIIRPYCLDKKVPRIRWMEQP